LEQTRISFGRALMISLIRGISVKSSGFIGRRTLLMIIPSDSFEQNIIAQVWFLRAYRAKTILRLSTYRVRNQRSWPR
ncbi:MAG TPA: hypothetical protein VK117_06835, partial [Pyrinomonadaceae bacterium]|nr:hypothetical protein [Pyrinomonadaceae bacterium]